ncbi:MAG: ThiF family adenylyltransferase, partial [Nitrospira sp.]
MRYSLSLRHEDHLKLQESTFSAPGCEGAAYLLCGQSTTDEEIRLLGREVVPVSTDHYLVREQDFLSLSSPSYAHIAKRARAENLSIVFVHSHPGGLLEFSDQDDREEKKLQDFFRERAPNQLHGSLVLTDNGIIGRVFDNGFRNLERIRILGTRFSFHDRRNQSTPNTPFFDRQVRAFGHETQALLQSLHIGVVGVGGTGSAVAEQLVRLGIGTMSIYDGDKFDPSNVNRLYGSSTQDSGQQKVDIVQKHLERIGTGTKVISVGDHITKEAAAKMLRGCDLIFGCTDKETPRAILTKLSLRYLIPVFDMGVLIRSHNSLISDVIGRVTTLFPGEACLFCRNRISPEAIRLESLSQEERGRLAAEGYAPELGTPNPAVIPFTTCIASLAVTELIQRLTSFMGAKRESSEVICSFEQSRIRTNRPSSKPGCLCTQRSLWGAGDTLPFLGSVWAT